MVRGSLFRVKQRMNIGVNRCNSVSNMKQVEKTKPILKGQDGHKVSYEKGLRQFYQIWMVRKQSQFYGS